MDTVISNGYEISGNCLFAIAVNVLDPEDAHDFTATEFHGDVISAFDSARHWASAGL